METQDEKLDYSFDLDTDDLISKSKSERLPTTSSSSLDLNEKKKRVLQTPVPKLDAERILGPRGLSALEKIFSETHFTHKDEFRNLEILLGKYHHWAHRLFPKLPFSDVMTRISNLGKKKWVAHNINRLRRGEKTTVETVLDHHHNSASQLENEDEAFEKMIREAEEAEEIRPYNISPSFDSRNDDKDNDDEDNNKENTDIISEDLLKKYDESSSDENTDINSKNELVESESKRRKSFGNSSENEEENERITKKRRKNVSRIDDYSDDDEC